MLSACGFALSASERGWRENRERALEEYGQKRARPGEEQPYGR